MPQLVAGAISILNEIIPLRVLVVHPRFFYLFFFFKLFLWGETETGDVEMQNEVEWQMGLTMSEWEEWWEGRGKGKGECVCEGRGRGKEGKRKKKKNETKRSKRERGIVLHFWSGAKMHLCGCVVDNGVLCPTLKGSERERDNIRVCLLYNTLSLSYVPRDTIYDAHAYAAKGKGSLEETFTRHRQAHRKTPHA